MPFHIKPPAVKKKQVKTNINKSIPQPPFRLLINGPSGSGKTVMCTCLCKEYKKYFKKIIVLSPSLEQYTGVINRRHDKLHLKTDDESSLEFIKHHYEKAKRRTKKVPMLIILDDCMAILGSDYFKELLLTVRKEAVSLIFMTHRFNFTEPIVRTNVTHLCLLKTSKNELDMVAKYFPHSDLYKKYDKIKDKKYSFMYISHNFCRDSFTDNDL